MSDIMQEISEELSFAEAEALLQETLQQLRQDGDDVYAHVCQ